MKIRNLISFILLIVLVVATLEGKEKIIVLGGGPAGLTAAMFAGQGKLSPLVIESPDCYAQAALITKVENFPGFPDGISGQDLVDRLHVQAEKFGARFQEAVIVHVDVTTRPFQVSLSTGEMIEADSLVIAMGAAKKWLGLPSEEALKDKGIYRSASLDAPSIQNKDVVVFGGGDTAMVEALTLASYASKVTVVYDGAKLFASPLLQEKVANNKRIEVLLNTTCDEILDVSQNLVTGVKLRHMSTQETSIVPCEGIFMAIGSRPNTDLFQGQLEIASTGHLVLKPHSTETSVPGVFAAGDVCDAVYRKANTAAAMGCMAALDASRYLSKKQ